MTSQEITVALEVNGHTTTVTAMADTPLLLILRNDLQLNGPKYGCGLGECGACTVIIDGVAARSCVFPLAGAVDRQIVTLEGLGYARDPHPVQQAFIDEQAAQCGYCLNGMIMTAKALLDRNSQSQRNRGPQRAFGQPLPLRHPYRNPSRGTACRPSNALNVDR
jgi:nicotinate dehydrogenase subunit A